MNPGFDKLFLVDQPSPFPHVERADYSQWFASGKGVNVARSLHTIGMHSYTLLNTLGGAMGERVYQSCEAQGLHQMRFQIANETRSNYTVIHTYDGSIHTVNDAGPIMSRDEVERYNRFVLDYLAGCPHSTLVVSGSAPVGYTEDDLVGLVRQAQVMECGLCVDIGGPWLKKIVEIPLQLLKVNQEEFHQAFGIDACDGDAVQHFKDVHRINRLVITSGKQGSRAWDIDGTQILIDVCGKELKAKCTVGCGDTYFAGLLAGLFRGDTLRDALDCANTCATANTLSYIPAHFSMEDYLQCCGI
ncbi:MAG: 1-phosphofructokinase family hexose kinase [Sphaerochaetaceae bacterium]